MTINTVRHDEVFASADYADKGIIIVGAGAIGSRVFENLVSTGLTNITLVDYDVVEDHNLANQLFTRQDIGLPKIEAAKRWAIDKVGQDAVDEMHFINNAVDAHSVGWFEDKEIVLCCVDSWDARRLVADVAGEAWCDLLVELRMATTFVGQRMVQMDNDAAMEVWRESLGQDGSDDYEKSACGSSLTVGATAQTAGAMAAWSVMNYLKTGFQEDVLRVDTSPWMAQQVGA